MKSIFNDRRLDRLESLICDRIRTHCSTVIRQFSRNYNEEFSFGRFLRNPKVTPSKLVQMHTEQTAKACRGHHVLHIEDSSEFSFGLNPTCRGLGKVGCGKEEGFFLHPVIAMNAANGGCLGLGAAHFWTRKAYEPDDPMFDPMYRRRKTQYVPFAEKDRVRWLNTALESVDNCRGATQHTVIADREADIYEAMCGISAAGAGFVIRQKEDRHLGHTQSGHKLSQELALWDVGHTYFLSLPKTDKRSAHTAELDVKWGKVQLARPKNGVVRHLPPSLEVHVVEVKERHGSVVNGETPVLWVLLTTHPVENAEQAAQIVQWYCWRWVIEQVFRTLKSKGLNIENSELETFERLANLATLALLSAVQIMQLVQARNGKTSQPISDAFNQLEIALFHQLNPTLEGNTEKQKNPHPPDSLAFASWVIARLGGWKGLASQRPPGPITMKIGLQQFQSILKYSSHILQH
jgi:hypothetical protein